MKESTGPPRSKCWVHSQSCGTILCWWFMCIWRYYDKSKMSTWEGVYSWNFCFLHIVFSAFLATSHINLAIKDLWVSSNFLRPSPHSFLVYTLNNPSSLNSNQDFSHCSSSTRTLCLKHLNEKILTLGKGRGRHVVWTMQG